MNANLTSKSGYDYNLVEQKETGTVSINSGSTGDQSIYAGKTGYTILGIVGIIGGSYASRCGIIGYRIENSTAYISWRNNSSENITLGKSKINILYRKNQPIS